MKKWGLRLLLFLFVLTLLYLIGPKVRFDEILSETVEPISIIELDKFVNKKESEINDLKPGNRAEVVWYGNPGEKTDYSVVYLHGFSASHEEGMPLHKNFAQRYGCNLYLSRLHDHGRVDSNSFKNMTPQDFISSAEYAIEVGKAIGDRVILMNCSTGATMGIFLAGNDPDIVALYNYSPNIDIYGWMDELLVGPWGQKLADLSFGGKYNRLSYGEEQAKFWNSIYHTDGILAMKSMINSTMTHETFQKITQPVFLAYYYKNEEEQDKVVSVHRMLDFFDQIATPDSLKRKMAIEKGRHVMTSKVLPSEAFEEIQEETYRFAEEVLGLNPQ